MPTSGDYWLKFGHNVTSVAENVDYVELLDASGKKVSASKYEVSLPDAELEREYRRYIYIEAKGLDAGATYTLHVSGELMAKNGRTLGEGMDVTFTTAADGEDPVELAEMTPDAEGSGDGSGNGSGGSGIAGSEGSTGGQAASRDGGLADAETAAEEQSQQESEEEEIPAPAVGIIAMLLLVVIVCVAVSAVRTKRRNE